MDSGLDLGSPPSLASLLEDGPTALFLDFDGTLVNLAPGPDAITPAAGLARRLADLDHRLGGRCAIVSGRAIADIERHIGTLGIAAAGSHGSDIRRADGTTLGLGPREFPAAMAAQMRDYADQHGLDYEAKPHGGALHYRARPERGADANAFARALAAQHGWVAQGGKCVVEIVASDANKGAAVAAFLQIAPFAGARPVFLGDDLTDEAGFRACQDAGGAGILIGDRSETAAQYALRDVAAVHQWLEL